MKERSPKEETQRAKGAKLADPPPGVKLLRRLKGHLGRVWSLAFDPQGETLASGSDDNRVKLWATPSGKLVKTLKGHLDEVNSVAFDARGETLASGGDDGTLKLWEVPSGKLLHTIKAQDGAVGSVVFDPQGRKLACGSGNSLTLFEARGGKVLHTLKGHTDRVRSVAFDPKGETLASGSDDNTVRHWDASSGALLGRLEGHRSWINSVAFDPQGTMLASGSLDRTVKLWEARGGKLLRTLEGHASQINAIAFSPAGGLLASRSNDQTIRLWSCETWETLAVIPMQTDVESDLVCAGLAFHPNLPLLAASGGGWSDTIHLWELDLAVLLGGRTAAAAAARSVHHTTGKIVLVGDHSVGKSALGYRLIHGEFKEQAATHGQQFWVFPAVSQRRADGTECEAILWDFAGQPDYRLVHALFLDNADLALVLFDASDLSDPLHGVGFWLKQLHAGRVAAR
jgi:WD40 repeat protein